ncbi:ATP-binding protein [Patescibacteria group bacterium]|nr:ATP-binding protein [Patescibacteria group bacterium]
MEGYPDGQEKGRVQGLALNYKKEVISKFDAVSYIIHNMNNVIGCILCWCELGVDVNNDIATSISLAKISACMEDLIGVRSKILSNHEKKDFVEQRDSILHMKSAIKEAVYNFGMIGENREMYEDIQKKVSRLVNESERLSSIILLNQFESGSIMEFQSVQLNDLIENIIQNYNLPSYIQININNLDPSLTVDGDPYFLTNMIENLLNNSVKILDKHNIGESKIIDIDVLKDRGNAIIQFKDNGCGFGEKNINSLFERNITDGDSCRISSHGVGLYACLKVCKAHGGMISAANRKDSNGAIFTIKLPLNTDNTDARSAIIH